MTDERLLHAYAAWCAADVEEKLARTDALAAGTPLSLPPGCRLPAGPDIPLDPGRPPTPLRVDPRRVVRRSPATVAGRAALLHAIAHIEFNAIDLALDIVWRFPGQDASFVSDWLAIAGEEALHFRLLDQHLGSLGFRYGDFPAHDGLWDMARRTAGDLLHRLAMVPRVLEARGLDASPTLRDRMRQSGDDAAADILQRILDDEIGHVATGSRWYRRLCAARGLDAESTFAQLLCRYGAPRLGERPNLEARRQAGFSTREMAVLAGHRSPYPAETGKPNADGQDGSDS